ncbi:MAG: PEGA domain-containing protein, partial [Archangium sp.]
EVDAGALAAEEVAEAGVLLAEPEDAGVTIDAGTVLVDTAPIKKQPLQRKKGRVNVITTRGGEPYWAQVSIDGVAKGRTPLLMDLLPGRYSVRIERSGFKSVTRDVRVVAGKPIVVKLELQP